MCNNCIIVSLICVSIFMSITTVQVIILFYCIVSVLQARQLHQVAIRMATSFARIVLILLRATHRRCSHRLSPIVLWRRGSRCTAAADWQLSSAVTLEQRRPRQSQRRLALHWLWRAVLVSCLLRLMIQRTSLREGSVDMLAVFALVK